mgnify:CR=1 FL=1
MKSFRIALLLMLILNLNLSAKSFKVNGIVYETWIDNTVRVIGGESSLRKVVIPDSVIYDGVNYKVVEINTGAFRRSQITSVTIPSSVVNVLNDVFYYCESLTTVVFELIGSRMLSPTISPSTILTSEGFLNINDDSTPSP